MIVYRQPIHFVQNEDKIVPLPLQNSKQEEQQKVYRFLTHKQVSFRVGIWPSIDEKFAIKGFKFTDDPLIQELITRYKRETRRHQFYFRKIIRIGYIDLVNRLFPKAWFMLQSPNSFTIEAPPKYPYLVAAHLARFIYPSIGDVSRISFALCDISLMHPLVGLSSSC